MTGTSPETNRLSQAEWLDALTLEYEQSMPKTFPEGFPRYFAEMLLADGAYQTYARGGYPAGVLHSPQPRS